MPLFSRKKSPTELIESLTSHLCHLDNKDTDLKQLIKSQNKCTHYLDLITHICYGTLETPPAQKDITAMGRKLSSAPLLLLLIGNITKLQLQARDSTVAICDLLVHQHSTEISLLLTDTPRIMELVLVGYDHSEAIITLGPILRQFLTLDTILTQALTTPKIVELMFMCLQSACFTIASDASDTLSHLLCPSEPALQAISVIFLQNHSNSTFDMFNYLLQSDVYTTSLHACQLLYRILTTRTYYTVMMKYVNNAFNLKLFLNLLKQDGTALQLEAFNIVGLFIANPDKSAEVSLLLTSLLRPPACLDWFVRDFHSQLTNSMLVQTKKTILKNLAALSSSSDSRPHIQEDSSHTHDNPARSLNSSASLPSSSSNNPNNPSSSSQPSSRNSDPDSGITIPDVHWTEPRLYEVSEHGDFPIPESETKT